MDSNYSQPFLFWRDSPSFVEPVPLKMLLLYIALNLDILANLFFHILEGWQPPRTYSLLYVFEI